jgi:hypothetical protein
MPRVSDDGDGKPVSNVVRPPLAPRKNWLTTITGKLILNLGGLAWGGAWEESYYPTGGQSFVKVNGVSVEVDKLTAAQKAAITDFQIYDNTGHAVGAATAGGGVSTGAEKFVEFLSAPELAGLQGSLSPLASLNPSFTNWEGMNFYTYGTWDSASHTFFSGPQGGKFGKDPFVMLQDSIPTMKMHLGYDAFDQWLIGKLWYPGVSIKLKDGSVMKIPDMQAAYSGTEQLTELDVARLTNVGYFNNLPVSVDKVNRLFGVNPLTGPSVNPQLFLAFTAFQQGNLTQAYIDYLNANGHGLFQINGQQYTLQCEFAPSGSPAIIHLYLLDASIGRVEVTPKLIVDDYNSVVDPADFGQSMLPGYGSNPLLFIAKGLVV